MKVIKFGGSSLSSSKNILKVLEIVKTYESDTIVVLSALGKTTNNIIACGELAANKKSIYKESFKKIEYYHFDIIRDLVDINYQVKILTEVQKKFLELENILDGILIREGRDKLARDLFNFLPKLSFLDLEGWDVNSLLSHK